MQRHKPVNRAGGHKPVNRAGGTCSVPHSVNAKVGGVFHLNSLFSFFSEVLRTPIHLAQQNTQNVFKSGL